MRKSVKKQREVPQPAKMVKVIVEEPQQRIVKQAKQTIQVAVQKTKTETFTEEIELETEEDRMAARSLAESLVHKERSVAQHQRELDNLAAQFEQKKLEHQQALLDITKETAKLEAYSSRKKTMTVTKTKEIPYTEMVDKKVRKVITETPVAIENWK